MHIEPTILSKIAMKSSKNTELESAKTEKVQNKTGWLIGSLAGLAAIGSAAVFLKKTKKTSYNEALKKAKIEIKDGIATYIESGEKYTGKIERYVTHTRKETVEFKDGVITEKVYHNLRGQELEGEFYKNGKIKLKVSPSSGGKHKFWGVNEYNKEGSFSRGEAGGEVDSVFDWAREIIKNIKD